MHPSEIITIILCVLIVGGVIGNYIYKKIKGIPTGECSTCGNTKKNRLLIEYRKKYKKQK